jgi:hypothetical protein
MDQGGGYGVHGRITSFTSFASLPHPREPDRCGDTVAYGEVGPAVDRVSPAAHLPAPSGVARVADGNVAAILEPMRNAAAVLAVTQPFREGRLQGAGLACDAVEGDDVRPADLIEHVGQFRVLGRVVGADYLEERGGLGRGRLRIKPGEIEVAEVGGNVLVAAVARRKLGLHLKDSEPADGCD